MVRPPQVVLPRRRLQAHGGLRAGHIHGLEEMRLTRGPGQQLKPVGWAGPQNAPLRAGTISVREDNVCSSDLFVQEVGGGGRILDT